VLIDVGAKLDQQSQNIQVTFAGGDNQGRVSTLTCFVDVSTDLDQVPHHVASRESEAKPAHSCK
jgi:hypothetical protein